MMPGGGGTHFNPSTLVAGAVGSAMPAWFYKSKFQDSQDSLYRKTLSWKN